MPEPKNGPSHVTTQADLEMDDTGRELETMEMVPIGKIEEVAKKELREARRQSRSRIVVDEYHQTSHHDTSAYPDSKNGYSGRGQRGQQPKLRDERWQNDRFEDHANGVQRGAPYEGTGGRRGGRLQNCPPRESDHHQDHH